MMISGFYQYFLNIFPKAFSMNPSSWCCRGLCTVLLWHFTHGSCYYLLVSLFTDCKAAQCTESAQSMSLPWTKVKVAFSSLFLIIIPITNVQWLHSMCQALKQTSLNALFHLILTAALSVAQIFLVSPLFTRKIDREANQLFQGYTAIMIEGDMNPGWTNIEALILTLHYTAKVCQFTVT